MGKSDKEPIPNGLKRYFKKVKEKKDHLKRRDEAMVEIKKEKKDGNKNHS